MRTYKVFDRDSLPNAEIIGMLRRRGWFVGRNFALASASYMWEIWKLGFSPLITEAKVGVHNEVFLVWNDLIVKDGRHFVVGFDRTVFKPEFPLGRIDLWDMEILSKVDTFPSWKGINFNFVIPDVATAP